MVRDTTYKVLLCPSMTGVPRDPHLGNNVAHACVQLRNCRGSGRDQTIMPQRAAWRIGVESVNAVVLSGREDNIPNAQEYLDSKRKAAGHRAGHRPEV